MKPSNDLFDLIKSLTKSEKRFFKLSSSLQSGKKNYLKIFDVIDKQDTYDEEGIKRTFKNKRFVQHFPSEKNHLYKLILKSLRAYRADNTINSILQQEIKNIEILYHKALYKEANKFLQRAKKKANEHEKFYYLYELMLWEKILLEEEYEEGEFTKDIDSLIVNERNVINKLRNLAAYHILYSKINYIFRSGGYVRNLVDKKIVAEISNHPLISDKNTALSKRATTICYYIKGYCALANQDLDLCIENFRKVKKVFDDNPLIKNDLTKRYINTVASILSSQIELGNYSQAQNMIKEMNALPDSSRSFSNYDSRVRIFTSSYLNELTLNSRKGDFEESVKLAPEIIEQLEKYENKINKEQEVLFHYKIAYAYFCYGDYNVALFWINKVLNDNEPSLRQDVYGYSRIFNLLIHFELGNFELLEYIIKSTHRYLNKRQLAYKIEELMIKSLKSLSKNKSKDEYNNILQELSDEIDKLKDDEYEMAALKFFDFDAWVHSKLNGCTISESIKNRKLLKA
ncbi:MAG: tetratricopeptide (TPR) repeat protein [Patiriisocius sp.]|jgi:tetratricopeptide (TPR) repeat protein